MTPHERKALRIRWFSWRRIWAMILRHLYVLRRSWPRIIELAYWPVMQILLWGFITQFLSQHSSLIAQAFQPIRYPILPRIAGKGDHKPYVPSPYKRAEILHIRHHSLFAPCDFDLSPFFSIVKPTLESGFDYKDLTWTAPGDAIRER